MEPKSSRRVSQGDGCHYGSISEDTHVRCTANIVLAGLVPQWRLVSQFASEFCLISLPPRIWQNLLKRHWTISDLLRRELNDLTGGADVPMVNILSLKKVIRKIVTEETS